MNEPFPPSAGLTPNFFSWVSGIEPPSLNQLCRQLGYGKTRDPSQIKHFHATIIEFIRDFVGEVQTPLKSLNWTERTDQLNLVRYTCDFLNRNQAGASFWPDNGEDGSYGLLQYSTDVHVIEKLVIQLLFQSVLECISPGRSSSLSDEADESIMLRLIRDPDADVGGHFSLLIEEQQQQEALGEVPLARQLPPPEQQQQQQALLELPPPEQQTITARPPTELPPAFSHGQCRLPRERAAEPGTGMGEFQLAGSVPAERHQISAGGLSRQAIGKDPILRFSEPDAQLQPVVGSHTEGRFDQTPAGQVDGMPALSAGDLVRPAPTEQAVFVFTGAMEEQTEAARRRPPRPAPRKPLPTHAPSRAENVALSIKSEEDAYIKSENVASPGTIQEVAAPPKQSQRRKAKTNSASRPRSAKRRKTSTVDIKVEPAEPASFAESSSAAEMALPAPPVPTPLPSPTYTSSPPAMPALPSPESLPTGPAVEQSSSGPSSASPVASAASTALLPSPNEASSPHSFTALLAPTPTPTPPSSDHGDMASSKESPAASPDASVDRAAKREPFEERTIPNVPIFRTPLQSARPPVQPFPTQDPSWGHKPNIQVKTEPLQTNNATCPSRFREATPMITREFPVPIGKQAWQAPGQTSYGDSPVTPDTPMTDFLPTPLTPFTPEDIFAATWEWDSGLALPDMGVAAQPGVFPQNAPYQPFAQTFASAAAQQYQQNYQQHCQQAFQPNVPNARQQFQQDVQAAAWASSQQGFGAGLPQHLPSTAQLNAQANLLLNTQPNVRPSYHSPYQPMFQSNVQPTVQPNVQPNAQSTVQPNVPGFPPSVRPNVQPNLQQNLRPNVQPNIQPSRQQSVQQSIQTSVQQTLQSIFQPSLQSSVQPSLQSNMQQNPRSNVQQSLQAITQPNLQSMQQNLQSSVQPSLQSNTQRNRPSNAQPNPRSNTRQNTRRVSQSTIPQTEQPLLPRLPLSSNAPLLPTSNALGIIQPVPWPSSATLAPSSNVSATNNTWYGPSAAQQYDSTSLTYSSKVRHMQQTVFRELGESSQMKAFDEAVRRYGPRRLLGPNDPSEGK